MVDEIKKELCTGCNACLNVCPKQCISMLSDTKGFWYPSINRSCCIECNLCDKICPSINPIIIDNWIDPEIYAAWTLDDEIRFKSTSGGIFSELAKYVIGQNCVVVGAKYNYQHMVEHYMVEKEEDIALLRQSKYLQSDIDTIFKKIKNKLLTGKFVAFCGSPCQVAGLLNFLQQPFENLITFDFVCKGANSPKVYAKYLDWLEEKYHSKIKKVWFKNKTYGWNLFSTKILFENNKVYIKDRNSDLYMKGYIEKNLFIRDCCFDCHYKTFPRVADITLADFWGVGMADKDLDPDKGTSLIMINSEKGKALFNSIHSSIFHKKMQLADAIAGNGCIYNSIEKDPSSDMFFENLDKIHFYKLMQKYCADTVLLRLKRKTGRILSKIKKVIKSLIFGFQNDKKALK